MTDDSLWGAMERLRLSTVAGLDRLDAMIADHHETEGVGDD